MQNLKHSRFVVRFTRGDRSIRTSRLQSTMQGISVNIVAPAVLWFHTMFPLGALVGALFALIFGRHSLWSTVAKCALGFWAYSSLPLGLLDIVVVFPSFNSLKRLEMRWGLFGFYLLLSGVGLQL